ncbi:putative integral membrane protein [Theileria parva strain Muguga]|uniref:putative integral membrane protein n=1 Tax=Theileria parva strain Muguga TaxID=333668 RepID=UPI001C619E94|nr:putative integral membrane protein [Theileria parva strain Muguga]KAF5153453.1 putative integral membrane protein [Theileria parva strain Muguga]
MFDSPLYIIFWLILVLPSLCGVISPNKLSFVSHLSNNWYNKQYSSYQKRYLKNPEYIVAGTHEEWRKDMADTVGVWSIFYPYDLYKAEAFLPGADIRPNLLFLDIAGRVRGPGDYGSPEGCYILDSKEYHHLEDSNNLVHSRRCVMVMYGRVRYSNLRLVLAGRMFYAGGLALEGLDPLLNATSAIFLGHTFLESYKNEVYAEKMKTLKRKVSFIDKQGNEINPVNWEYQKLDGLGSSFRWMHGNSKWKLVGPFTCYKSFGVNYNTGSDNSFFPEYADDAIYNVFDPLEHFCRKFTSREYLEDEVRTIIRSVLKGSDKMTKIKVEDENYLNNLEEELVALGDQGPDYYRGTFE